MCNGVKVSAASCPATEALENLLKKQSTMTFPLIQPRESSLTSGRSLKRSRSSLSGCANQTESSFDMTILIKAAGPVEDSIAFPTIEWNDDIDSDNDEDTLPSPPPAKRRCGGLLRTTQVTSDLSSYGHVESLSALGKSTFTSTKQDHRVPSLLGQHLDPLPEDDVWDFSL